MEVPMIKGIGYFSTPVEEYALTDEKNSACSSPAYLKLESSELIGKVPSNYPIKTT